MCNHSLNKCTISINYCLLCLPSFITDSLSACVPTKVTCSQTMATSSMKLLPNVTPSASYFQYVLTSSVMSIINAVIRALKFLLIRTVGLQEIVS